MTKQMSEQERKALSALRFNWAPTPDDVWSPTPFHVDGLHSDIMRNILAGVKDAHTNESPIGVAILGQKGSGKTHMLGMVRSQVQQTDCYFFLVSLLDGPRFWESVALSLVDGLMRLPVDQPQQLTAFLERLSDKTDVPDDVRHAVTGKTSLTLEALDSFVAALRKREPQIGQECQHTLRALVLNGSEDFEHQDIGYGYLLSRDETETGANKAWHLPASAPIPQLIVRDISRLLALTGPSVIAVDQIDQLVAQSSHADSVELLQQVAGGLMSLRECTRRTLTVVACLPATWILIRDHAVATATDRFRDPLHLQNIPSPEVGQAIVERRMAAYYSSVGFKPNYKSWPVKPAAFASAVDYTARRLLIRVDNHVRACLSSGVVEELATLDGGVTSVAEASEPPVKADELSTLDARFAQLRDLADVRAALDPATEDVAVPALLAAGLTAWIGELGEKGRVFTVDAPPGNRPPLHARLRRSLDESTEDEVHWAFRAIGNTHHSAALNRLRAASTAAGLSRGFPKRKLFVLRNAAWNTGPKTQAAVAAFTDASGARLDLPADDLKTFSALGQLLTESDPSLQGWLASRHPASKTALLRTVLGEVVAEMSQVDEPAAPPVQRGLFTAAVSSHAITLGGLTVDLESLRKHTAIFAGSGSGKTVLIRRLIEECALSGVSAIVLDPNNDLARLGDAWPEVPKGWSERDADRAADYLANTDVVVWTPMRDAGRPLTFQPMPDFRGVVNDPDEFRAAIESAVASLAPRAKVDSNAKKAERGQAVLRNALEHFARQSDGGLKAFISLLSDLPEGVSVLDDAEKIAADLAQTLTAAMVNDPMFGGAGEPIDPGVLLTPPKGKRARVSVISFAGLPSDDQRQGFVNQLQMALFSWIKRHPAGERPLGGLFVMDEAQTLAPSGAMTACTQSTLALVSQARKYGLGLVFATQAPKGLHNRIPGNAATQFFGLLNAPVQIEAAKEMARAKGCDVSDIARLGTGQFYASGEGFAFQRIQAPMCLTHHPKSPLTLEEVLARAAARP